MSQDLKVAVLGPPGALTDRLSERIAQDFGRVGAGAGQAADAVVYLPPTGLGGPDLEAAARLFKHGPQTAAAHTVVISSAAVNEPNAHHPGHVREESLAAPRNGNPVARAWLALEETARRMHDPMLNPTRRLTILRPTTILARGGSDVVSRLFTNGWAPSLPGFDPSLQLLSFEDLARAVCCALSQPQDGIYNIAPAGVIPLSKAMARTGTRRFPIPACLHGHKAPAGALEYLRYPWTVSGEKIRRQLGFEPRHTSAEALAGWRPPRTGSRSAEAPAEFDDYGMDKAFIDVCSRRFLRFMHDVFWRVEWRGLDRIPRQGRAVLAGVHRGFMPWDGVMALHLIARELGRFPRFMIHPTLVKFPFLAPFFTRLGGVAACRENAAWVLERDRLLAVYPEGIRGAFTLYRNAYRLGRFGRDEYVRIALRHRAPIVPFVTVGSAEIFPILGAIRWRWFKRWSEWPFLPITPTMGLFPLPSKWHTRFLEPLHVEREHPPEAADDPAIVRAVSNEVRRRMERAIDEMLERRRSIFFGSIWKSKPRGRRITEIGPLIEEKRS